MAAFNCNLQAEVRVFEECLQTMTKLGWGTRAWPVLSQHGTPLREIPVLELLIQLAKTI